MSIARIPSLPLDYNIDLMSGEIGLDEIRSAPLRDGLALWRKLRGERLFPTRQQMSPRALGPLLRNTVLIKVLDDGAEFQFRVVGDVIAAFWGTSMQGFTMTEVDRLMPGYGKELHRLFSRGCSEKVPLAFSSHRSSDVRTHASRRTHMLLPLGETNKTVDYLITLAGHIDS